MEQRTTRRSTPLLTLIAVSSVLPAYRTCDESVYRSPLEYMGDAWSAAWIAPVFIGAAAIAALSVRALIRKEVDLQTRRLSLAVIGLLLGSTLVTGLMVAFQDNDWPMAGGAVVAAPLAALMIRRARGLSSWKIWDQLLFAFAIAAAGAGPTVFLACSFGSSDVGWGAYVYLGAIAALLLVARPRRNV